LLQHAQPYRLSDQKRERQINELIELLCALQGKNASKFQFQKQHRM